MTQNQSQTLMGIINQIEGINLHEKKGASFKFRIHMTKTMRETSIDALELSVRSYHSLKRAGYENIGKLVEAIAEGQPLKNIRNCGEKSVREIMEHLFLFQYNSLPVERRDDYLREVVRINIQINKDDKKELNGFRL